MDYIIWVPKPSLDIQTSAKEQGFLADPMQRKALFGEKKLGLSIGRFAAAKRSSLDCFLANARVSMCASSRAFSFFFKRRSSRFNLGSKTEVGLLKSALLQ